MPNYKLKCALAKAIFNSYSHIKDYDGFVTSFKNSTFWQNDPYLVHENFKKNSRNI
jgi:hypothetical protein